MRGRFGPALGLPELLPAVGPAMPDSQAARLPHFPVSLFASVMGVGGLSLA